MRSQLLLLACAFIAFGAYAAENDEYDAASQCDSCEKWNEPQQPFRIYGNTYYVGAAGVSAILIDSGVGLVLLDGGLPQTAAYIVANIEALGFAIEDVQVIGLSHAHFDHAGGIAALQRLTGAVVYTSSAGEKTLLSGDLQDDDPQFLNGKEFTSFSAVRNLAAIDDRKMVTVGGVDVTAIYTPGHTPGGMSWSWESCAMDTCYDIVYADSLTAVSAQGYRFSDGPAAQQLIDSADAISELDCDILLSPHPFFFGMQDKLKKRDDGNPFVNNVACMIYAETSLGWLEQRLHSEGS